MPRAAQVQPRTTLDGSTDAVHVRLQAPLPTKPANDAVTNGATQESTATSHPLWPIVCQVPNAVTCLGLVCGLLALHECAVARGGNCASAAWLVMLCYYFDVLDGALARVMGATSDIGATLDDVADFVCHGAAPVALLVCINAPRQDVTFFSKVAESSWTVLLLCGAIVALSLCRTVHVYATKSVQPTGTFYHGLPTTYVGPSIAAMYVLTGSSTAATLAAVGLTVALLPTMDRPAEGMMESQNWKRWSFLAALLVSLVNMRLGALCTLVLVSLYAFVPSIFLWDQSKPTRLFGGSQQGSLLQRFLINRQNAY